MVIYVNVVICACCSIHYSVSLAIPKFTFTASHNRVLSERRHFVSFRAKFHFEMSRGIVTFGRHAVFWNYSFTRRSHYNDLLKFSRRWQTGEKENSFRRYLEYRVNVSFFSLLSNGASASLALYQRDIMNNEKSRNKFEIIAKARSTPLCVIIMLLLRHLRNYVSFIFIIFTFRITRGRLTWPISVILTKILIIFQYFLKNLDMYSWVARWPIYIFKQISH